MATLSPQQAKMTGTAVTYTAVNSADQFKYADNLELRVKTAGTVTNVTIVVPGNTQFGQAQPDIVVAMAATEEKVIGPFVRELIDPADGFIKITYSSTTACTAALVRG